jgi:hypothetical protein
MANRPLDGRLFRNIDERDGNEEGPVHMHRPFFVRGKPLPFHRQCDWTTIPGRQVPERYLSEPVEKFSMDKELSFTATILACGQPINCLGEMSEGPVILDTPNIIPAHALEGAQTLGVLDGSDEDWAHAEEMGLITFRKAAVPESMLLYFRHSAEGYRLYVRRGACLGYGVFKNANGLIEALPMGSLDPTAWRIIDAQSNELLDLSQLDQDQLDIQLVSSDGQPVELHTLYPVGGFLACHESALPCSLTLQIENRQVDWLGRD